MVSLFPFTADLHVHSCLSPCGDIMMLPNQIARRANEMGIDVLAITDHNTAGNVEVFEKVLSKYGVFLIPGIEIQTIEEVHILAYFSSASIAIMFSKSLGDVYLPQIKNIPEEFGYQLYCDENDEFTAIEDIALMNSISLSLSKAIELVKQHDGVCIFAHIYRTFGVIRQLGFLPKDVRVSGCEIRDRTELEKAKQDGCDRVFISSDAHLLESIVRPRMRFYMKERSYDEFVLALNRKDGRRIELL
ncbi:MAG: histidinol-phosphatase [Thermotoga sp.]|nr:MAG: histidinol-phosphatase [Thermotoga sp.]